jgi:hypothetical protein
MSALSPQIALRLGGRLPCRWKLKGIPLAVERCGKACRAILEPIRIGCHFGDILLKLF